MDLEDIVLQSELHYLRESVLGMRWFNIIIKRDRAVGWLLKRLICSSNWCQSAFGI